MGVLLGGLSPVFTKLLLEEGLSREALVGARYLLAMALLAPFGLPQMRRVAAGGTPRLRDWVVLFLVGALGSGVGALLFTAALEYSSAGIVNSISKTAPIFVAFFGYLTMAERVSSVRLLLVGAMVGADALIGLGELSFGAPEAKARLLGDGLALLAGLTRATAEVLAKGALVKFSPSTVAFCRFGAGFALTGGLALFTGGYRGLLALDARGLLLLALLAWVSTALSMYLYYRGTRDIPVHVAVSLKILGAVVTAIVSWIVLRETLNLYHVAGMGMLISGSYLLVLRSARETVPAASPAPAAEAPRARRNATDRLRVRLTLMLAALIVATVLAATVLSVRHTSLTVRRQVRLTMGKVAAVLVQLTGLEEPLPRSVLQQYVDRLVHHRVKDQLYSIDIVYIAIVDPNGSILAFAVNDDIRLRDPSGRPYRITDPQVARGLLEMSGRGELGSRQDLIPVRASLRHAGGDGRGPMVEIGCKRSIANRVLAEIIARNVLLVLVLMALGVALAASWVRRITHPLERIAAAMKRLSGGELDLPLVSEGRGEVRAMGESLQEMRETLRAAGALRRALISYAAGQMAHAAALHPGALEGDGATERTIMLLKPGPEFAQNGAGAADMDALAGIAVDCVLEGDGVLLGHAQGALVAAWGAGPDEALLAAMVGVDIRDRVAALLPGASAAVCLGGTAQGAGAAEAALGVKQTFAAVSPQQGCPPVVLVDGAVATLAGEHLVLAPSNYEGLLTLIGPANAGADLAGLSGVEGE